MTKLFDLALAAEARGKAHAELERARRTADAARADLEAEARELVDMAAAELLRRTPPGGQIPMPVFETTYARRRVLADRREAFRRRNGGAIAH